VYVFTKSPSGWKQVAELKGSDTAPGDEFGFSIGISGTTAVVGPPCTPRMPASRTCWTFEHDGAPAPRTSGVACPMVKPGVTGPRSCRLAFGDIEEPTSALPFSDGHRRLPDRHYAHGVLAKDRR